MKYAILLLLAGVVQSSANADFIVNGFGPEVWGANDATIGVEGYSVEDFEDKVLASGLSITWQSPAGNNGPTNQLPSLFNPQTDDSNGIAFTVPNGTWDGTHGVLNTRDNQSHAYNATTNWGDITFAFTSPVSSVGFSLDQLNFEARLVINGVDIGGVSQLSGLAPNGSRQGYVRIDATNGSQISTLLIDNGEFPANAFSDGILIDHLAFSVTAVPEPSSGICILSALILLASRYRRTRFARS